MIIAGKSNSVDDISLEELERARRMNLLSEGSGKIVRDAIREDVIKAEELERQRRLAEMGWENKYSRPKGDLSWSEFNEIEEEERRRRILEDDIMDKIRRLGGLSKRQVIQAEEQERQRRIREADLLENVYGSPYLPRDQVIRAEEDERQRRIAEDKFIDKINSRPQLSLQQINQIEEAERARRIQEDKYIDEIRSRDSLSKDQVIQAEERERQRRIMEDNIIDEVRSRPTMSWSDVNDIEERERSRRIYEDEVIDKVWSKPDLSRNEVIALEEKERTRRLQENILIDRQSNPSVSRFEVVQMEEKERERRLAEDKLDLEKEKLLSKFDLVTVKKLEEAERQRRIEEESRDEALQEGSRRLAGAQVVAMEELERSRRIAEDRHIDESLHQESLRNRELSRLAEEAERNRRVSDIDRKKHSPDYPLAPVVPAFVPELLNKLHPTDSGATREVPSLSTSNLNSSNLNAPSNLGPNPISAPSIYAPVSYSGLPATSAFVPAVSGKKLIAVLGGTGQQGGAVIRGLLSDGKFAVRTLSRNGNSYEARKLFNLGVEVLQGSVHNESDLLRLFSGAYGVFALTDNKDQSGKETQIGMQIAKIAKQAGVSQFVWSTLPNAERISAGKYRVPHFTEKAKVNSYIRSLGFPSHTFVLPSFYFQNFFSMFAPKEIAGKMEWTFPMNENSYLPAMDINDMGTVVTKIFNEPNLYHNQKLRLASENLKPQEYFINMSLITKTTTKVHLLDPHDYARLYKLSPEFVEMFSYYQEFGLFGRQDPVSYHKSNGFTTWAQFLQKERSMVASE
jgi:uncharacterized protein YbjT (DUF2867 family)